MPDVTQILAAAAAGDPRAAAELLPLVYDGLRKLAAARLAGEKPAQTLQPTALAHEAYLRLVGGGRPQEWNGRGHFFAAAAEAMRRIQVSRPAARGGSVAVGAGSGSTWTTWPSPPPSGATICLPSTRPSPIWPPRTPRRPSRSSFGTSSG